MRKSIKLTNAICLVLLLFVLSSTTALAYTDQELCDMALQHYADKSGYAPTNSVIDSASGNSVTIHLYNVDGNHTTTSDWYTVNRVSGAGTNFMGEPIDLTPYAPTPSTPDDMSGTETQDSTDSEPISESTESTEEESVDADTEPVESSNNDNKNEDNTQKNDVSPEAADDADKALVVAQKDANNNSFTKNILLVIAAVSSISSITGIVIIRHAKPSGNIFCQNCGAVNMKHANFCTQCGKPIESIRGIKRFMQCFKSPNKRCRIGSWMASLSVIVCLVSAISALALPKSVSNTDVPVIANQAEKEPAKAMEPSYEDFLKAGHEQLAKKDYTKAEESFYKALKLEPEKMEAYQYLVDTYVSQEDMKQAAEVYKDAVKIINDNYSSANSLVDDGEELYLKAIDFFEAQDDEEYAIQLVEDILSMTKDQGTIAKLEEKQKKYKQIKSYAAYNQLLNDYIATYGEGTATGQGYNSYLSGLCFAKLIDFDQDGDEELLLAYYDAEKTRGIWVHEVEVWTYDDELRQIYANQSLSDGGMSSSVALSDINGKPCISSGTLGMPSKVSMWGYTGEQFAEVGSINYDPGVQYIVNGASVTNEECQSALNQWENEVTKYWLLSPEQDCNQALAEISSTHATLQYFTNSTSQH